MEIHGIRDLLTTHLFLSITSNRLEVSTEPSKSAGRELTRFPEAMNEFEYLS